MKKPYLFILALLGVVLLSACTATPVDINECVTLSNEPSGFWLGLWHGCIAPVTFILSLFVDKIEMYDVFNNGGWYNFGFVLGAGILFGGSGSGAKRMRRRE